MPELSLPEGMKITGPIQDGYAEILTPQALAFVAELHRRFNDRRLELLHDREERQKRLDAGEEPDFLPGTRQIREGNWKVNPLPADLQDRRVEITGPVDRKMIINALNSGARVFMADFEDASSPTWDNCVQGQINLRDAIQRTISLEQNGKQYRLNEKTAVLLARPRGWHLPEKHVTVDGEVMSGSLFDFGLYFFHNAQELLARGSGPYFYLPKMESHLEARLWNDVFNLSQDYIKMPRGTIRGTVLIETITAAFEMEEILYELREHSSGLNCGRWDYIFSFIKRQRYNKSAVLPDRATVTMTCPFMQAYVNLLIQTCHKRGAAAIGGMAAQIPIKGNEKANNAAMDKVRADKLREVLAGHDGTWVAHPALVPIALEVFNKHMLGPNQYHVRREEVRVSALDLLNPNVDGQITEAGARANVSALLAYCANWVRGNGCVPINHLMEDAATAEISRISLWQWVFHGSKTVEGKPVTPQFIDQIIASEAAKLTSLDPNAVDLSRRYLSQQVRAKEPSEFLTTDLTAHLDNSISQSRI